MPWQYFTEVFGPGGELNITIKKQPPLEWGLRLRMSAFRRTHIIILANSKILVKVFYLKMRRIVFKIISKSKKKERFLI